MHAMEASAHWPGAPSSSPTGRLGLETITLLWPYVAQQALSHGAISLAWLLTF